MRPGLLDVAQSASNFRAAASVGVDTKDGQVRAELCQHLSGEIGSRLAVAGESEVTRTTIHGESHVLEVSPPAILRGEQDKVTGLAELTSQIGMDDGVGAGSSSLDEVVRTRTHVCIKGKEDISTLKQLTETGEDRGAVAIEGGSCETTEDGLTLIEDDNMRSVDDL